MISTIDKDLIMVVGDPTGDYKRRSMGLRRNTLENVFLGRDRVS